MSNKKLFLHLIIADIKRLKNYIPALILLNLLLLCICSIASQMISEHVYGDGNRSTVRIAYFLPEDDDSKYSKIAINMLSELDSMQETAELIRVNSADSGRSLMENGEITALIIIPELFLSSIMDSTNLKLDLIIKDNTRVSSYITNELMMSYAGYLGVAQAAVYSMLDTAREHGYEKDERQSLQNKVDSTFLNRTLHKNAYIKTITATNEGSFTLKEFYLACAAVMSLLLSSIALMPMLTGRTAGMINALSLHNIGGMHLFFSSYISSCLAMFAAFIPCHIALSLYAADGINIKGLFTAIPALLMIALIAVAAARLGSRSLLAANMLLLFFTVVLAYVGGGLIPQAMLPAAINDLSSHLPCRYIIDTIANAIFI